MNNKIITIVSILTIASIFALSGVHSQPEPDNVNVVIIPDSFMENDNATDGQMKLVIRVVSGATNTLSGVQDLSYNDKVIFDINKPNRIDNKIVTSIIARELALNRNVTNITWVTGKQIYP